MNSHIAPIELADFPVGSQREVVVDGQRMLLLHTPDGPRACAATCTHAQKPLIGGRIINGVLHCPHHAGKFDLRTGQATGLPAWQALRVFPAWIADGMVHVTTDGEFPD